MLVDPALSGMPAFLTPKPGLNSGFMIPQVTAAALVSETNPWPLRLALASGNRHPAAFEPRLPDRSGKQYVMEPVDQRRRLSCARQRYVLLSLACAHDDQPYILPIHFSFDAARNCLYAFSTVGQKIAWMRQNPKVCVAVEDVTDKDHWTTVLVFGRYEELTDSPDDAAALKAVIGLFQQRAEWWLPATAKLGTREHHEVVIYRIQIDQLTGRRASRDRA